MVGTLEDFSGIVPASRRIGKVGSVAHQTAKSGKVAPFVDGWNTYFLVL
jgi:hypothetical protein